jgi:hypothetical protein
MITLMIEASSGISGTGLPPSSSDNNFDVCAMSERDAESQKPNNTLQYLVHAIILMERTFVMAFLTR